MIALTKDFAIIQLAHVLEGSPSGRPEDILLQPQIAARVDDRPVLPIFDHIVVVVSFAPDNFAAPSLETFAPVPSEGHLPREAADTLGLFFENISGDGREPVLVFALNRHVSPSTETAMVDPNVLTMPHQDRVTTSTVA